MKSNSYIEYVKKKLPEQVKSYFHKSIANAYLQEQSDQIVG